MGLWLPQQTGKMSYVHLPTSPSPESTPARRNKTEAELLQILSNDIRSKSGPFNQEVEIAFARFMTRTDVLGGGELRMLIDYAGHTLETRTGALEKMLSHRVKSGDQAPIVRGAGTGKHEEWICRLCPEFDPTQPLPAHGRTPFVGIFQKVAMHITSRHWGLRSWICQEDSCTSSYRSHDSLTRHKKQCHNSNGQPNAISPPSTHAEAIDTITPRLLSSVNANPELPASTSYHIRHAVDRRSSQGWSPDNPHFYDTMHYTQAPLVRDKLPTPLPSPLPRPVPNPFVGAGMPSLYHPQLYGIDPSMDSSPPHVTNATHHFHRTGGAQYFHTNATSFPVAQYHYPRSNMNQRHIYGHAFGEPAFNQPGPSSPFASSITGRSIMRRVRPNPRSYSPRNEMRRQAEMPRVSPSFGRFGGQQFTSSTEELARDTFQRSDQGPWLF